MKSAWLSQMVVPGSLLFKRGGGIKDALFVLSSNENGVMCWPTIAGAANGQFWIDLDVSAEASVKHIVVYDHTEWSCQDLEIKTPAEKREYLQSPPEAPDKILLVPSTYLAISLLKSAALQAFRTLTVPYMKKLYKTKT